MDVTVDIPRAQPAEKTIGVPQLQIEEEVQLLRYHTSHTADEKINLQEYISRTRNGQHDIYCVVGERIETMSASPIYR